jgi:hypothetical protein
VGCRRSRRLYGHCSRRLRRYRRSREEILEDKAEEFGIERHVFL